jgi:hypothetical protein
MKLFESEMTEYFSKLHHLKKFAFKKRSSLQKGKLIPKPKQLCTFTAIGLQL